ncbi:MAG TPA: non-heme iron oxygenase ferredoxin subunit [Acidimicrobiales bacterium]|nr:non-heme iron oxygenase ferredoxin subunit [Acidimicrobiales bacterium]
MAREIVLCGESEMEVGTARRFDVDGAVIALVRCSDGFRAVADTCSHEDYSLAEGEVYPDECEIECWKHGSTFSLLTGQPMTLPATQPVKVYEILQKDGEVSVVLP